MTVLQTNTTERGWKFWRQDWSRLLREREDQVFLVLTIVIGGLVGLAVVGFIVLSERVGARLYPLGGAAWRRVLVPVLGALGTGYLLFRFFPNARGSGVPQTKAALYAHEGFISLKTVLGKFFCTSASLASGIPLGREGPAVQVGAGIASVLGRRLGLSPEKVKSLLPIGTAAAIAAAFNTPLAAVLFTLEELMGDLHAPVLGSVVLSSATSWMVLRLLLGNEPLFHVPQYQLAHPLEFGVYAVLGILGGFVSVVFVKLLLWLRERFQRMPKWTEWFQPVAGGLLVGFVGWVVPSVLGVGYGYVGDALNQNLALRLMALLVALKLVTVAMSYASGNAGGIFGPSLFIGAMLGGAVGSVAHLVLPQYTATPGAYALVGMGTVFAGIIRTPMTSVIMIFETTRDYAVIVPLMISNLIAFFISVRLQPRPIYEELALQDGIHLPSADVRTVAARYTVARAMRSCPQMVRTDMTVLEALETIRATDHGSWPVGNEQGVAGIVSVHALEQSVATGQGQQKVAELTNPFRFPHVHKDQPLDLALERMGRAGLDVLPVVSRANVRRLEGIVVLEEVLRVYGLRERQEKLE